MRKGHTITRESGELLGSDLRKRRFGATRRSSKRRVSTSSDPRHFRTPSGGIPAYNDSTKQLGSATCREWVSSETGVLSDNGNDEVIYNQHPSRIPGSTYVLATENEAGLLVVVERSANVLRHVKTNAACAARNIATGAMSSVACRLYLVATDGSLTDTGINVTVFNPGGPVGSGMWMTVLINEAGQFEFVVARCGS